MKSLVSSLVALAAAGGLATAGTVAPDALARTSGQTASTGSATSGAAPVASSGTTRVSLTVAGCSACELTAYSYYLRGDREQLWSSRTQTVGTDGRVAFRVPTELTRGMSFGMSAPWEQRVGAAGTVVLRYAGQQPGSTVRPAEARQARRGSACHAGTDASRLDLGVRVLRAHFPGNGGTATAAAAYATTTQRTEGLTERTHDGFLGTQDAPPCFRA